MNLLKMYRDWRAARVEAAFRAATLAHLASCGQSAKELLIAVRKVLDIAELSTDDMPCPNLGICANVSEMLGPHRTATLVLCRLFEGWPSHSGRFTYPISYFNFAGETWEGEELALRIDLLKYVARRLEAVA